MTQIQTAHVAHIEPAVLRAYVRAAVIAKRLHRPTAVCWGFAARNGGIIEPFVMASRDDRWYIPWCERCRMGEQS
jgi:hypothetical protein